MFYCAAHWVFAVKYWIISYKLGGGTYLTLANQIYVFVLVLNLLIPVFFAVEAGMDLKNFALSYQLLIFIQVWSCLVQFDACRRFYIFINKNTECGINIKMVCFHVSIYFLYLGGLIYFYFTFIMQNGVESEGKYLISIGIKNGLEFLSLIALSYLFYILCCTE